MIPHEVKLRAEFSDFLKKWMPKSPFKGKKSQQILLDFMYISFVGGYGFCQDNLLKKIDDELDTLFKNK